MKVQHSFLKVLFLLFVLFIGCVRDHDDPVPTSPVLTTSPVTDITGNTAKSGGNISSDGGAAITERGICWSITSAPTTSNSKTTDGTGAGSFVSSLVNLAPNTIYYTRAYARNNIGTSYGNEIIFTTAPALATIATAVPVSITSTTATSGGNITSDGGSPITERGVCWNTTTNPLITNTRTIDGSGAGNFISNLTNLSPGTVYYGRAYAKNNVGVAYGNEVSFTTSFTLATLSTATVSGITSSTAVSGGNITSDGGSPITERGVCWSINFNPTISNTRTTDGSGTGSFISNLTNLSPGTVYYVRAYAKNNAGIAYGDQTSFVTPATLAAITTTAINNLPGTTANGGGNISNDGGATITARGVCWGTTSNPLASGLHTTDGTGIGSFNSSIMGLSAATTYYVRAYATNSVGTAYGNEISFTSTTNTTFFIGQNYGGGIIYYIDGTGQHGFISSPSDQFPGIVWYNGSFVLTNASSNIDGSGNTTQIINVQGLGAGTYAARMCREFTGGGFTDWFLPSKDQLNILYNQKAIVGNFAGNVYYWSSTENDIDHAWMQNFSSGNITYFNKSSPNYIRAIRSF